jgi:hypothetical protein
LLARIPTNNGQNVSSSFEHLWITQLAPRAPRTKKLLFWTAALAPHDERKFWKGLGDVILNDTGTVLEVRDYSPNDLWSEENPLSSLHWSAASTSPQTDPAGSVRFFRVAGLPASTARGVLSEFDDWFSVVSGDKDSLTRAVQARKLADAYLPPCGGTIAVMAPPLGIVRRAADFLSESIAKHFS